MMTPGSPIRSLVAAAWCVLVGAAFLLAQLQAFRGAPMTLHDPIQERLQQAYAGCLAIAVALLLGDLYRLRRRASAERTLHEL